MNAPVRGHLERRRWPRSPEGGSAAGRQTGRVTMMTTATSIAWVARMTVSGPSTALGADLDDDDLDRARTPSLTSTASPRPARPPSSSCASQVTSADRRERHARSRWRPRPVAAPCSTNPPTTGMIGGQDGRDGCDERHPPDGKAPVEGGDRPSRRRPRPGWTTPMSGGLRQSPRRPRWPRAIAQGHAARTARSRTTPRTGARREITPPPKSDAP